MRTQNQLRVAVIGAGAFGRNHARVYHELSQQGPGVALAAVVDTDIARARELAGQFGAAAYGSIQDALSASGLDAASVAVPTAAHLEVARTLMEAGVDVLVEKPLAASLAEADELIRIAGRTGRIAQVGHLERFNPAVRATLPLITQPMFFEVHRLSVFSPRALDVDVVLDLMVHDLDVVLAFMQSPIAEVRAAGIPILSDKVDIANVRMEFESGCVANFTASRVSTERVRKLRFFQPRQYVSIDYARQDVILFSVGDAAHLPKEAGPLPSQPATTGPARDPLPAASFGGLEIRVSKPPVAPQEPLHAELRAFLDAVRMRSRPLVPLEDGRRVLAVALGILDAIAHHNQRVNLEALRG